MTEIMDTIWSSNFCPSVSQRGHPGNSQQHSWLALEVIWVSVTGVKKGGITVAHTLKCYAAIRKISFNNNGVNRT